MVEHEEFYFIFKFLESNKYKLSAFANNYSGLWLSKV